VQVEFRLQNMAKSLEHLLAMPKSNSVSFKHLCARDRQFADICLLSLALQALGVDLQARVDGFVPPWKAKSATWKKNDSRRCGRQI
jgi:hypothetical protein